MRDKRNNYGKSFRNRAMKFYSYYVTDSFQPHLKQSKFVIKKTNYSF